MLIIKKNRGVTLIEIMLMIIVLALLSLYTFAKLQSRSQQLLERTAAVEMKNLLEASLAYYADFQHWPEDLAALWETYLPQSAQCSPWPGEQEEAEESNKRCPGKKLYQGQSDGIFYSISVTVPSSRMAAQLAARLPRGLVKDGTVSSSIRVPGTYHGWLASAGITNDKKLIYLPKCPNGYEGHFIEVPQYQTTGYNVDNEMARNKLERDGESYFVRAFNKVHSPDLKVYKYAYYLTFCVPIGQWYIKKSMLLDDAQCSDSWMEYNGTMNIPTAQKNCLKNVSMN